MAIVGKIQPLRPEAIVKGFLSQFVWSILALGGHGSELVIGGVVGTPPSRTCDSLTVELDQQWNRAGGWIGKQHLVDVLQPVELLNYGQGYSPAPERRSNPCR